MENVNVGMYAPQLHNLIVNLATIKDKEFDSSELKTKCTVCGEILIISELRNHWDRCSSIGFIKTKSDRYLNKKISAIEVEKIKSISKEIFDTRYITFLNNLIEIDPKGKKEYKNIILAIKGRLPKSFTVS